MSKGKRQTTSTGGTLTPRSPSLSSAPIMSSGPLPISPTGGTSTPPPPPPPIEDQREIFFPAQPFRIHALDFGLAFGIAAAIFMLFAVIIALLLNHNGMKFFEDIFAGFQLHGGALRVLIGVLWSFVTGFVLGTVSGFVYNFLLRKYVVRS